MQVMEVVSQLPKQCLVRPSPARASKSMNPKELLEYLGDAGVQFGIPFTDDGPDWEQSMLNCFDILWHEDNHLFFRVRPDVHAKYAKLNHHNGFICLPEPIDTPDTFFCDPMGTVTEADNSQVAVVRTHSDDTGKRHSHAELSCHIPVDLFQSWHSNGSPTASFRKYEANGYKEDLSELL